MIKSNKKLLMEEDAMEFVPSTPDVEMLASVYNETRTELNEFKQQCDRNFDTRMCIWAGKSEDNRKHTRAGTKEPFPWDGASDQDVPLVDEIIKCHTSMLMNATRKANIVASPVGGDDVGRAKVVAQFLKWLLNTQMSEFYTEVERSINHLLEKGIAITHQHWVSREQKIQQKITIEQIAQANPEAAALLMEPEAENDFVILISSQYGVGEPKARKMIRELREEGASSIPITIGTENRPGIRALAADEDVFFPSYTVDIQEAPYVFHVQHMTPTQLREMVLNNDWNENWVEYVIEHGKGDIEPTRDTGTVRQQSQPADQDDLIEIVYCYQRLIDDEGVPGIYCTVFHPKNTGVMDELKKPYAKHELTGYYEYPFTCTKLEEWSKRLYETRGYPEIARGFQNQLKVEIDSQVDRAALQFPPLEYPAGRPPVEWRPGGKIPYRVPGEVRFADMPALSPASMDVRNEINRQVNRYFGRNAEGADPTESAAKQQDLINRVFDHLRRALEQVFTLYQQYGPDEEYFRVTGVQDVQKFDKGQPGERFDFWLNFDIVSQDPEHIVERVDAIAKLGAALDKSGTLDTESLLQMAVEQIGPGWGERVILPKETASQKAVEEERMAIAQITSGIDLDVRPNDAHEVKMQVFQQWIQQPDIQEKIQQDEGLKARIDNYAQKRMFQMQQQQNASIGRLGGTPSQFGAA